MMSLAAVNNANNNFNQNLLLSLLENLKTSHQPAMYLREIARMRIPEGLAKSCRVLEQIEPLEGNPETQNLVDIIKRKYHKAVDTNRLRREKAASAKKYKKKKTTDRSLQYSQKEQHHIFASSSSSSRGTVGVPINDSLTSPLQIEIPAGRIDETFYSNDLLAQKPNPTLAFQSIEQLLALNNFEQMVQAESFGQPLKFGPGLQQSETSAFRPFVAKPKPITLAEIFNSSQFREIYRRLFEEDEARRTMANPSIDQILDEMNMLNTPMCMLRRQLDGSANNMNLN